MHKVPVTVCFALTLSAGTLKFREHVIADDLKGGCQVVPYDVNHDGKIDLIALASGMTELVWFENPTWERHVIARNLHGMINLAAVDVGGDGIPEIVLAHGFSEQAKNSIGIISVLKHRGDPRKPWSITEIDRLPTSHRLRVADIDGSGKKVVVNAALTGDKAEPPDYRDHAPLVFYRPGDWKRHLIDNRVEGVVYGLTILDWDGDGSDEILIAGFEGIYLYKLGKGGQWERALITKSRSGEVAVGNIDQHSFLASIEPWHGNQVAVYQNNGSWQREVIDESLVDGQTIVTANLERRDRDAIIAGSAGKLQSVYIYTFDWRSWNDGRSWNRQTLDEGGMAAASCAVADLNGRGTRDIACIGSTTHNLKWYENLAPWPVTVESARK